jgi:hypothetical protein
MDPLSLEVSKQTLPSITIEAWQAILGAVVFIFGVGAAWGTLKTDIRNISKGLADLKRNFDDYILGLAQRAAAGDGQASSPYQPSQEGKDLLNESGAGELISTDDFKNWIFRMVDERMPKADFEVEAKVLSVLIEHKHDARWDKIKEFIFNHPVYSDRPLTIERILTIISWILRDEYIQSRNIGPAV